MLDRPGAAGVTLAVSDIERVQVLAHPSRVRRSALRGAVIGGIIAAVATKIYLDAEYLNDEWNLFGALVFGAPAGVVLGGLYGAATGQERWREVPISELRMIPTTQP